MVGSEFIQHVAWALWFLAPAGTSIIGPMVAARLPKIEEWDTPVDLGHTWRGKRIFGDHKTWRGLVAGVVFGGLTGLFQMLVAQHANLSFIPPYAPNYNGAGAIWLGMLLGTGAGLGDCLKSLIKRQVGIAPGKHWFPFDQIDYIIGAYLLSAPFVHLIAADYLFGLAIWFGIHLISAYIGYLIHWKDEPF
jgi:CDP-2,3-bis-(O-geranylgeranyl)-sn-glycerol synthase